ncbi:MAG: hypothetical protein O7E57_15390 [Gammaproteobacteria bacterium]|nr:hypothetical protein [Gammaproteobacteria bacterium]
MEAHPLQVADWKNPQRFLVVLFRQFINNRNSAWFLPDREFPNNSCRNCYIFPNGFISYFHPRKAILQVVFVGVSQSKLFVGLLVTTVLLSVSFAAEACRDPVRTRITDESFPDEVSAVRAMRGRFLDTSVSQDVEFFGAVLQEDHGDYRATFGQGCRGVDKINFSVSLAAGAKLSAFWHTHGRGGLARNLFSAEDAATVLDYQLPFYLIDSRGLIRVLDPAGASTGTRMMHGSRLRLNDRVYSGHIVSDGQGHTSR